MTSSRPFWIPAGRLTAGEAIALAVQTPVKPESRYIYKTEGLGVKTRTDSVPAGMLTVYVACLTCPDSTVRRSTRSSRSALSRMSLFSRSSDSARTARAAVMSSRYSAGLHALGGCPCAPSGVRHGSSHLAL